MRDIAYNLAVSLAILSFLASESRSESIGKPAAGRIAQLINQLGSKKFQERELAARELDAAGAVALESLKAAGRHPDPEISRRAESLAQRIEKRIETAQILEPKCVHLNFRDTPLDEAVAEFARKTGFTIDLQTGARDQRITLDTGETTFWQALDQFCKKAGLVEQATTRANPAAEQAVRVFNGRGGAQMQMMVINGQNYTNANVAFDGPLHLMLGKPQSLPTFYAGAVRVRALPNDKLPESWAAKGETAVALEVFPQQKMGWQPLLDVQVEKAVDEHGQSLSLVPNTKVVSPEVTMRAGNRALMLESESDLLRRVAGKVCLRFNVGDKSSKILKELKGTLNAQVQTPLQPLVTIDDVLKSAGKTFKGKDGRAVAVTEVSRDSDGGIKMRISLEEPVPGNMVLNRRVVMRANRVVVRNGVVIGGGIMRETGVAGESKLALLDAAGQSFPMEVNSYAMSLKGTGMVQDMQLTFQPHSGQFDPVKFVYSDHRLLNIEIPFVLKDVPLPGK